MTTTRANGGGRFGSAGVVVGLVLSTLEGGCAEIVTTTEYSETLVSRKRSRHTVEGSLRYTVTPELEGQLLTVTIGRAETCRTEITPTYRKVAHVTRRAAPRQVFSPTATALYGSVFGASGAYAYLGAEGHAAAASSELTADEYRATGIVLGATGAVLLGIALVDALRLVDYDEEVGTVVGEPEAREETCNERVVSHAEVVARVGRLDFLQRATADADGVARLELHDLPEDAFSRPELGLTLEIDGATVPLVLDKATTRRLLASLESDARSRVARDRRARARAACEEQVAIASATTITGETSVHDISRAEASWRKARQTCGSDWQPEHELSRSAFNAQVAATASERAMRACAEAGERARETITERLSEGYELRVEELEEEVAGACADAGNANVVRSAFARVVEAAEAERTLAAEREERIERLVERMRRSDAVGVRAILSRDREIGARLRSVPEASSWLSQIAMHWIRKLERGDESASVRQQLCAARALVVAYARRGTWARLRAEVVGRAGVARGARIAKLMDGGACS